MYNTAQWSLADYARRSMTPLQRTIKSDLVILLVSCSKRRPLKPACIVCVISVKYYNASQNKIKSVYSPLFIFFYIPLNLFCFTNSCESRKMYEKHTLLNPDRVSLFQKTTENTYQILLLSCCCFCSLENLDFYQILVQEFFCFFWSIYELLLVKEHFPLKVPWEVISELSAAPIIPGPREWQTGWLTGDPVSYEALNA